MRSLLLVLAGLVAGFLIGFQLAPRPAPARSTPRETATPRQQPGEIETEEAEDEEPRAPPVVDEAVSTTGIMVRVLDPSGEPAVEAQVGIHGDKRRTVDWTPDSKFIECPPGFWTVEASRNGDATRSATQLVRVRAGAPGPEIVLQLMEQPNPGVRVEVTLPPGIRARLGVSVVKEGLEHRRWIRSGRAARRHAWRFPVASPGIYVVDARYHDSKTPVNVQRAVRVEDRTVSVAITLPRLPAEGHSTLRVIGPDGSGVAHPAKVKPGYLIDSDGLLLTTPVGHLADGSWILNPVPDWVPADAVFTAEIESPRWGKASLPWSEGGTIRLAEPGGLIVQLREYEGVEIRSGLWKRWHPKLGQWTFATRETVSSDGQQGFAPLQPGTYTLVVSVKGSRAKTHWPVVARKVTISSGQIERVAVEVPKASHDLRLIFSRTGKVYVARTEGGIRHRRKIEGKPGELRLEGLPAGKYQLLDANEEPLLDFEIPREGVLRVP